MCLEPGWGNDGSPRGAGNFQLHGRAPWSLGLSVPICKMDGLESQRGEQCPFFRAGLWDWPPLAGWS